ncbi:unnamed protein product [Cunninghamella blakesleeana]
MRIKEPRSEGRVGTTNITVKLKINEYQEIKVLRMSTYLGKLDKNEIYHVETPTGHALYIKYETPTENPIMLSFGQTGDKYLLNTTVDLNIAGSFTGCSIYSVNYKQDFAAYYLTKEGWEVGFAEIRWR